MTSYFVSRHPGALAWAAEENIQADRRIEHLAVDLIQRGDVVIGTLPINLVAEVCARGGRYLHLSLDLPPEWRGRDLTAEEMRQCGARVEEYRVIRIL